MTTPPRGEVRIGAVPRRARPLAGLLRSARPTTRVWFDLLAPAAMLTAVWDGAAVPLPRIVLVFVVAVLFHASANFLNDANDTAVDAASAEPSRHLRASITGEVGVRDLTVAGWVLVAVCLLVSALLPWPTVLLVALLAALSAAYNCPPVRLSGRPYVLQVFWPAVWTVMFACCAIATGSQHWRRALPFLLFVALFMGVGEGITQDIRDVDNDAAGGRRTTPVVLGLRASTAIAWTAQFLSLGAWLWFAGNVHLAPVWTVAGGAAVAVWLAVFGWLGRTLWYGMDKRSARLTHLGPIAAFSVVNLTVVIAGLTGGVRLPS
jgi:geranylgeranylglycerol-phosphate geranylgeranyltransferase